MYKIKTFIFKVFLVVFYSYCTTRSVFVLLFGGIEKPRKFRGYHSLWFAKKFADKRTRHWKSSWDQSGKRQGVLPYNDDTLLVCSAAELRNAAKRRLLRKGVNPHKLIKRAYYTTAI